MLRHIILVGLITSAFATKLSYKNYKVYRIIPGSERDLKLLNKLEEKGFSYWRSPSRTMQSVDLMVAPEKFSYFEKFMGDHRMKFQLIVKDVQQLIDQENPPREKRSLYNNGTLNLNQYHTLDEMYKWFHDLEKRYPNKVEILVGGKSYDGLEIKGVHINHGADKPAIFLEGGIHAHEWISPATIICLTKWILKTTDYKIRQIIESYNWYMFPVVNPDGYVYTFEVDRFWRKNRSKNNSTECVGTDLNRNWNYHWDEAEMESQDPCSDSYKGSEPFSEIETSTLSQFIKSISEKIEFYIPFHSYGHYLLFPQSSTEKLQKTYKRYVS
ncbi:hypothetical protein QAD02_018342 [Eretmocerus hayati]|uniref:Uncharacterized protein n=1 Tax=Eretmocerus hayati TaxID=131215 RepID=A0ACC2PGK6_9HYME|nr:hypothetical protein QAD02_018342 [Eretmocerus hayati]